MSLLEKISHKESEPLKEEVRKRVDKEVNKLREYEKLGFIGSE